MATKKRKARGGKLWVVIDTRTGEIAWLPWQSNPAWRGRRESPGAVERYIRQRIGDSDIYCVQRILWRPAPARRRAKRGN